MWTNNKAGPEVLGKTTYRVIYDLWTFMREMISYICDKNGSYKHMSEYTLRDKLLFDISPLTVFEFIHLRVLLTTQHYVGHEFHAAPGWRNFHEISITWLFMQPERSSLLACFVSLSRAFAYAWLHLVLIGRLDLEDVTACDTINIGLITTAEVSKWSNCVL